MNELKEMHPEFPALDHPVVLLIMIGREHDQHWAKTRVEKYHMVCFYKEGQDQIVAVFDGEAYSVEDSDEFVELIRAAHAYDEEQ